MHGRNFVIFFLFLGRINTINSFSEEVTPRGLARSVGSYLIARDLKFYIGLFAISVHTATATAQQKDDKTKSKCLY
jgi:hypothetical protein